MSYTLTPEQAASITDPELVFGATRLLPEWDDIPEEFKAGHNLYCKLASCLFYGTKLPELEVTMYEGFTPQVLQKCVRAHLVSFAPKHELKMAGVGFMISKMATLTPVDAPKATDQSN
ncbi:hypothetical protein V0M98_33180 (plasmid) [Pseudomonas silesiensis]|uniref:hypothetical protein n=1 Tax=Pseudomonas silesiensis TaxID=1853130 RepID=UPI0030D3081F